MNNSNEHYSQEPNIKQNDEEDSDEIIEVKRQHDQSKQSLNFTFDSLSQNGDGNNNQDPTLKAILDTYKPESKEIDLDELRNSNHFFLKKFPDALFFGECVKAQGSGKLQRHGKGVMKYHNTRVFEGEWENDQRHGRGYERYPNGNIY